MSKDRSIAVWDMQSAMDITLRRVLVGHRAAVNVVDFDDKYIVSASGDRTIKVWSTVTSEFIRTLNGHKRGIACLQYRDRLVVSGSSDNTIRYCYCYLLLLLFLQFVFTVGPHCIIVLLFSLFFFNMSNILCGELKILTVQSIFYIICNAQVRLNSHSLGAWLRSIRMEISPARE